MTIQIQLYSKSICNPCYYLAMPGNLPASENLELTFHQALALVQSQIGSEKLASLLEVSPDTLRGYRAGRVPKRSVEAAFADLINGGDINPF